MSEKKEAGYRGPALDALQKAQAEIGDMLRIEKNGESYEGILIPRSEYGDENHIVVKLRSGYNIGLRVQPNIKIEKKEGGVKPRYTPSPQPKKNRTLPQVAIISTGGTIASRVDYRTGAVRPALTANDLYHIVPELADIAQVDAQILFSLYSENITPKLWTGMACAIAKKITEGVKGVVLAHGTDTMAYTAAALSFALQKLPVPVILVGSQRSADRPSSDAATNLIGAVTAAATAPFAEVAVAMHGTTSDTAITLHRGTKVRKCHTSRRDAFKSVNSPPIGSVQNNTTLIWTEDYVRRDTSRQLELKADFNDEVALIKFYPGMPPAVIEWYVAKRYRAIVLEGTGLGHISKNCFEAIQNAIDHEILVTMTSQCIWGRINMNVYDQGRDLLAFGVVPLHDALPETALVKLMWIFGQTSDPDEAKRMLQLNMAYEFSQRTLAEESE